MGHLKVKKRSNYLVRHDIFIENSKIRSTERLMSLSTRTEDKIICSVIKDCIIMKDERSGLLSCSELEYIIKTLCTE